MKANTVEKVDVELVSEPSKLGRSKKYETYVKPRFDEILSWIKDGYNEYSVAEQLGIHIATWCDYKNKHSELSEIVKRARTDRNSLVMNAQFKKATGIKEIVPKPMKIKEVIYNDKGKRVAEKEKIEYANEYIYVPPDHNAADLYLRNNDPNYKTTKDSSTTTLIQNNFQLPAITEEIKSLEENIKALENQLGQGFEDNTKV